MPIYERTRRIYWAVLSVPVLGTAARRIGESAKHALRRAVSPTDEPIDVVVATQRDAIAALRTSLDGLGAELRHESATTATALATMEETHARERDAREAGMAALAGDQRAASTRMDQLAGRDAELQEAITRTIEEARLRDEQARRRVEFVRQEMLFEMRAATAAAPRRSATVAEPEIVSREKYEAMRAAGVVRVNVGCGHLTLDEYLNVDARRLPGVDVVAEAAELPLDPETVDEIYSSHLLEHFPIETLRRVVLPAWVRLLKPGGHLRAVVPDAEAMIRAYGTGEMSFDDLREVTFGLQEYDGDFHFGMFTPDYLRAVLAEAGLAEVAYVFTGRRNGKCFDMEIRATKAAG